VAEPAVGPACDQDGLFYAGAAFAVPAVGGFTQATRLLLKNGKCKMSFVLIAHLLAGAVSVVLGVVHLMSDMQSLRTVITVAHMFGFTCLGVVLSATLFMWGSVHQLIMRITGSSTNRSLKLFNIASIFGFVIAAIVVAITGDDMLSMVGSIFVLRLISSCYHDAMCSFVVFHRQHLHVSLPCHWQPSTSCSHQERRSVFMMFHNAFCLSSKLNRDSACCGDRCGLLGNAWMISVLVPSHLELPKN
jgi:hypothetical protein